MFYFLLIWSLLIFVCLVIGTAILHVLKANCFQRKGDRFIISIWLGIITLTILFLTISFFLPLSSIVGFSACLLLVFGCFLFSKIRQEVLSFLTNLKPSIWLILISIEIIVAGLVNQQIVWFDTGMYHWVSIKWLSEFGTVTGVALTNSKLAFNAGWFAFSAPLHLPILNSHAGAISNGFVFFVATVHFCIAIQNLLNKNLYLADGFILIYSCFTLPIYTITVFTGSPILISFSADIPVNFFIGVISWSILLISSGNKSPSTNKNNTVFSANLIPLILALGTTTIKLSALPLLPITFLFSLNIKALKLKSLLTSCLISVLMLMPMFLYGIQTSGCPLYPSRLMCIDVPWKISEATIIEETNQITGIVRDKPQENLIKKDTNKISEAVKDKPRENLTKKETNQSTNIERRKPKQSYVLLIIEKRWKWLKSSIKFQIMIILLILSIIFAIYLIKISKIKSSIKGYIWLLELGFLGMIFILSQIPLIRFGLGYFILISCLFIATILRLNWKKIKNNVFINYLNNQKNQHFFLIVLSCFSLTITFNNMAKAVLLLPPELPKAEVIKEKINDVEYFYPANWTVRCWDTKLPCAGVPIQHNIKLKDSQKGIAEGFINYSQNN